MSLLKNIEGRIGEEFAVSHLRSLGFEIIDRNFRIRGGEIDIIAIDYRAGITQKTKALVFIEVKTRTSELYGSPLEAITYHKLRTLVRAAHFYKMKHPHLPELMRIDAVAVTLNAKNQLLTIELVKNIS